MISCIFFAYRAPGFKRAAGRCGNSLSLVFLHLALGLALYERGSSWKMVLATRLNDFIGLQRLWWFCLCQGTIAAQFNCEGTTLSGVEFELSGSGYRVSLVKRRFVSGRTSNFRCFKQLCPFLSNSSNRKLCVSLSGKLSSVKSLKCSFFRYWFSYEWILLSVCPLYAHWSLKSFKVMSH